MDEIDKILRWEDVIIGPKVTYQVAHYKGIWGEPHLMNPIASRYDDAVLHNENSPAVVTLYFDPKGMLRIRHEYFWEGFLDRLGDKPALVDFDAQSPSIDAHLEYYSKGVLHRIGGPTQGDYTVVEKSLCVRNAQYHCNGEALSGLPSRFVVRDKKERNEGSLNAARIRKFLLNLNYS